MRLSLVSSMLGSHVFVTADADGVTYTDVSFGMSEDGKHALELFKSSLARLGVLWEPRCDSYGNWAITSDILIVEFGPYNPNTCTNYPKIIAYGLTPKADEAFEHILMKTAVTSTKVLEPKKVILQ